MVAAPAESRLTPTPTALSPQNVPRPAPPTAMISSPAAQAAVPRTAHSPTGVPAAASGNSPPNASLMGCDGENARSAALTVAENPSNPGVTQSSVLPVTAVASVQQVGLLLQPNAVQPAQLKLPLDQVLHVVIENRGAACRFGLDPFLQSLANGSADFIFEARTGELATLVPSTNLTAGCIGDPSRQVALMLGAQPGP